jgi:endonuclease/exonuclease/phosphatase family metal-dependent hydrolase
MTFLFWNTRKKSLAPNIARIVQNHDVDVVFLAENSSLPGTLSASLAQATGKPFRHVFVPQCRVTTYTHLPPNDFKRSVSVNDYVIWKLRTAIAGTIFVAAAHLDSKLYKTPSSQRKIASDLALMLRRRENRGRAKGTALPSILIGDMNMNPFDPGDD